MAIEHFDVIVVGAGLSGIGAGHALQTHCKGKRYAILEGRDVIGGTWDLFRYPGVRSDTDMYTLSYSFRPWTEKQSLADGASILQYVRDTAHEFGIGRRIRFRHRVHNASWSSSDARWTLRAEVGQSLHSQRSATDLRNGAEGRHRRHRHRSQIEGLCRPCAAGGRPLGSLGFDPAYQGLMLSGLPNFAFCVGYTNASWTLRADLASRYVTRLLKYMERRQFRSCTPTGDESTMRPERLIGLQSGYVLRAVDTFPKQGAHSPWRMAQNYYSDLVTMRFGSIADANFAFAR